MLLASGARTSRRRPAATCRAAHRPDPGTLVALTPACSSACVHSIRRGWWTTGLVLGVMASMAAARGVPTPSTVALRPFGNSLRLGRCREDGALHSPIGRNEHGEEFDLVVRGGTWPTARALLRGRRRGEGRQDRRGRQGVRPGQEIDAKGLLVTPGFVDIHTHYDGQATWDSHLQPSSWHGVTTAVMGNCGVGFAPVKIEDRQRLIELMEGVEDIPGAALDEGLNWSWESFGQYLDALEARPRDMDLGAQLPHGALRVFVMGERAARLEEATPEEVARMRALTAEAMRDGALGFSTSRTLNHRTVKGDPTPSLRASEAELLGIALGMKDAGRGVIEFISDFNTPNPESEFEMIERLLTASRPAVLGVAGAGPFHGPRAGGACSAWSRGWSAKGHAAKAQVAPRPIGVLQGLQASRIPFSMCRSYKAIQNKSVGRTAGHHARSGVPREAARGSARAAALRHGGATDRLRPHVPAGRSAGLRAGAGELAGRPRPPRGPRPARGRLRLPDRRRGQELHLRALRQLRRLQSRLLQRDDAEPAHADRAGRRRRACRPDLRRLLPDLAAVALGPRPRLGQARRVVAGQAPHARTMPGPSASTTAAGSRRAARPTSTSSTSTSSGSRRR